MFKDILAYLPPDNRAQAIIDCAVSLAHRLDAHLDGIAVVEALVNRDIPVGATSAALELVLQYEAGMKQCAQALRRFETAAKAAGVSCATRAVCDTPDPVDLKLLQASRLYDLAIVIRPERSQAKLDHALCEAVLFDSGRPMLIVPGMHRGALDLDHISICWNGGRQAARAVHDALPLLRQARTIDIIAVNEDDVSGATCSEALASHLHRHQLSAHVRRLRSASSDVSSTILLAVADAGSHVLVMGCDGYARYKEFRLGEVTHGIIDMTTIPAFVAN
jgi:hypothetical protein